MMGAMKQRSSGRAPLRSSFFLGLACIAGVGIAAWSHSNGLRQIQFQLSPSAYWPLDNGNRWTYAVKTQDINYVMNLEVKRHTLSRTGGATATMETDSYKVNYVAEGLKTKEVKSWVSNPWNRPIVVRIDDTGIYWLSDQHGTFNPPVPILKAGVKGGQGWTWSGKIEANGTSWSASATLKAAYPEKVKTPQLRVKEHDAMGITMILDQEIQGQHVSDTQNFAFVPRIGPVKFGYSKSSAYAFHGGVLTEYRVR